MRLVWQPVTANGIDMSSSITPREIAVLVDLARGRKVLEIGSAFGYSTIMMASVAESVLAVDPFTDQGVSFAAFDSNVSRSDWSHRINIEVARSQDYLPVLIGVGEQFDGIFVDGCHWRDAVDQDLANATKLVKPGGWIAVHDVGESDHPSVQEAVRNVYGPRAFYLTDTLYVTTFP